MYWTLDNRPPNLDEIIAQGSDRIRKAVEDACARFEAPQIEVAEVNLPEAKPIECTAVHDHTLPPRHCHHNVFRSSPALPQPCPKQNED